LLLSSLTKAYCDNDVIIRPSGGAATISAGALYTNRYTASLAGTPPSSTDEYNVGAPIYKWRWDGPGTIQSSGDGKATASFCFQRPSQAQMVTVKCTILYPITSKSKVVRWDDDRIFTGKARQIFNITSDDTPLIHLNDTLQSLTSKQIAQWRSGDPQFSLRSLPMDQQEYFMSVIKKSNGFPCPMKQVVTDSYSTREDGTIIHASPAEIKVLQLEDDLDEYKYNISAVTHAGWAVSFDFQMKIYLYDAGGAFYEASFSRVSPFYATIYSKFKTYPDNPILDAPPDLSQPASDLSIEGQQIVKFIQTNFPECVKGLQVQDFSTAPKPWAQLSGNKQNILRYIIMQSDEYKAGKPIAALLNAPDHLSQSKIQLSALCVDGCEYKNESGRSMFFSTSRCTPLR